MPARATSSRRELDSRAKALLAVRAALEKHADAVAVLDLQTLSTVTDFFVIAAAGSSRQLEAIREHIEATLRREGAAVLHTEGSAASGALIGAGACEAQQWILMDCGDVVVHLLDERARDFYRLEQLWADAPRVPVPPL